MNRGGLLFFIKKSTDKEFSGLSFRDLLQVFDKPKKMPHSEDMAPRKTDNSMDNETDMANFLNSFIRGDVEPPLNLRSLDLKRNVECILS